MVTFMELPGELRNRIYDYVFSERCVTPKKLPKAKLIVLHLHSFSSRLWLAMRDVTERRTAKTSVISDIRREADQDFLELRRLQALHSKALLQVCRRARQEAQPFFYGKKGHDRIFTFQSEWDFEEYTFTLDLNASGMISYASFPLKRSIGQMETKKIHERLLPMARGCRRLANLKQIIVLLDLDHHNDAYGMTTQLFDLYVKALSSNRPMVLFETDKYCKTCRDLWDVSNEAILRAVHCTWRWQFTVRDWIPIRRIERKYGNGRPFLSLAGLIMDDHEDMVNLMDGSLLRIQIVKDFILKLLKSNIFQHQKILYNPSAPPCCPCGQELRFQSASQLLSVACSDCGEGGFCSQFCRETQPSALSHAGFCMKRWSEAQWKRILELGVELDAAGLLRDAGGFLYG